MKKHYSIALLAINFYASAQMGINNSSPKSTLDITATRPTGTLNPEIKDGIIIPNLDRARAQAIGNNNTPVTAHSTLIYVNNATTGTASQSAKNIQSKGFYFYDTSELPAPGAWQPLKSSSNLDIYTGKLKIPPHREHTPDFYNHSSKAYDSDNWWVISKTSIYSTPYRPARMIVVYEFQGNPFNTLNLHPQLTAGNDTTYPDVYTANVISIANNGTGGKTKLTVTFARSDDFLENWKGTFFLNVLLAGKIN